MDRGDHALATFFHDGDLAAGARATLDGGVANHVRVRRLHVSDVIGVTNGRGVLATGAIERIDRGAVEVLISECTLVTAPVALQLFAPVGDRDRMLWLAEKCAELRITTWQPVLYQRSRNVSPRGEGDAFGRKVRARMISALEQSGSAWLPEIRTEVDLAAALALPLDGQRYVLDRDGEPALEVAASGPASVIVGPEGGLTPDELSLIQARGWQPISLGAATLRFETAGVAAVGVLRAVEAMHREA